MHRTVFILFASLMVGLIMGLVAGTLTPKPPRDDVAQIREEGADLRRQTQMDTTLVRHLETENAELQAELTRKREAGNHIERYLASYREHRAKAAAYGDVLRQLDTWGRTTFGQTWPAHPLPEDDFPR